jgi:stage V sporulation protein AD
MEAAGPLAADFDELSADPRFAQKTWEQAETEMQSRALSLACKNANASASSLSLVFAGDLLNQCTASSYSMRSVDAPFIGLYGACSTFAEGVGLAAMTVDGGYSKLSAVVTSSHFCSAERQFRLPLEYGGQRPPTSQWTATAAGAALLAPDGDGPAVTAFTAGKVRDAGIKDSANMGAAMAVAAYETLYAHLRDTSREPDYYDLIITGDLSAVGADVVRDFFRRSGITLSNYSDCGLMLYDRDTQDVHSGGSGCGCSASVICGHVLKRMRRGELNRVLFAGTGALMSPICCGQGESIPAICHAVSIENLSF